MTAMPPPEVLDDDRRLAEWFIDVGGAGYKRLPRERQIEALAAVIGNAAWRSR
jgi:hypothetical protein